MPSSIGESSVAQISSLASPPLAPSSHLTPKLNRLDVSAFIPRSLPSTSSQSSSHRFSGSDKGKEPEYVLTSPKTGRQSPSVSRQVKFDDIPANSATKQPIPQSPIPSEYHKSTLAHLGSPFESNSSTSSSAARLSRRSSNPFANALSFNSNQSPGFTRLKPDLGDEELSDELDDLHDDADDEKDILREYTRRESKSHFSAPIGKFGHDVDLADISEDSGATPLVLKVEAGAQKGLGLLRRHWDKRSYNYRHCGCCSSLGILWDYWWFKLIVFAVALFILIIIIITLVCLIGYRTPSYNLTAAALSTVYQSDLQGLIHLCLLCIVNFIGFQVSRNFNIEVDNSANFLNLQLYRMEVTATFSETPFVSHYNFYSI